MASLRKHPRSPYWFACYNLPDGRRTQRSTKQTDRRKAERIANAWEDVARQCASSAQFKRVLSDIHKVIHGEELTSKTIRAHFDEWAESVKSTAAPATASAYAQVARDFLAMLGTRADRDLRQLGTAEITQFRAMTLQRVSAATANKQLKILRVCLGQAIKDGLIESNPAAKVDTVKVRAAERESRRPFTLDELRKVLSVCSNEWRGIVLAGIYTGQRLGDITSLTWSAVDLEQNFLSFVTAKTGRRQQIPLAAPLRAHLESLPVCDDPRALLFPKAAASNRRSNQFYDILVAAGLAKERTKENTDNTGKGRRTRRVVNELSFHCLRHTATSLLKIAGVSQAVVMDLIGHDTVAASLGYTHVDEAAKRAAIQKLPEL